MCKESTEFSTRNFAHVQKKEQCMPALQPLPGRQGIQWSLLSTLSSCIRSPIFPFHPLTCSEFPWSCKQLPLLGTWEIKCSQSITFKLRLLQLSCTLAVLAAEPQPFTLSALTARSRKEGRCCTGSTRGQAYNSQSPSVVSASPPRSQFLLFGPWCLLIPVTLVFLLLCSSTPSTLSGQGEESLWSCFSVLFQNHCLSVPCRAPDFCAGRQSEQLLWKIKQLCLEKSKWSCWGTGR